MTSTNMFQGLDTGSKPSSRVLRPPGGGSSNLFGGFEDDAGASRKPHKMASNIFGSPEQPESNPKRSNPPGGKTSGIFGESEPRAQPQRNVPPGGQTSNIFGGPEKAPVQSPSRSHPNKPKDNLSVGPEPQSPAPQAVVITPEVKEEPAPPAPTPTKEEPTPVLAPPKPKPKPEPEPATPATPATPPPPVPVEKDQAAEPPKNHEPHLGPKPRSHNRVLNPPGGKSSVVFY
ncbi:jupiter microtubule associated homolog 2 [Takifugu flavidus]|uniref:Jupiter microtubule associated-like protein 2 n=1 Tax=Takifugu flavidus TaxID=433684 RepID=A0A5C6NQ95_9TELE|nr:jupiter microtubule associated homolog 2 [Takifugu flavidus]TWW69594.1 Jupiter microtubule associated -like protein 2 [Takifugu flavidus]